MSITSGDSEGVDNENFAWVTETKGPGSCRSCGNSPAPTPSPTPAPPTPGGKTDCNAYLSIRSCPGPPDCQWDSNMNRCKSVSAPSPPPSNKKYNRNRR